MPASQLSTGITTHMPPAEPRQSKDTDTRVRSATGGHPKTRAPASFLWTVSQNQAVPTSAGHMRTAILIHPGAARRAIKFLWGIPHNRHTAASLMIQAGYPPKMLQEIMGHASITTTLDLYGHLYPGEMDRYADRLNEAAGMSDPADDAAKMWPDDDLGENQDEQDEGN